MIRRIVLLVALVAGLLFAPSTAAWAADCDVPAPRPPKAGLSGMLTAPPATPATGDPFADPTIPIHQVWGTSWHWTTTDIHGIQCATTPSAAMHTVGTSSGNLFLSIGGSFVGLLDVLERLATESGIGWFADWIGQVMTAIRPLVFGAGGTGWQIGLLPLALLAAGVGVVWLARRADLAEAARRVMIVVACIGLATFALGTPGAASRTVDGLVGTVAEVGSTALNGSLADGVGRHAVYRAWLSGQFGDPDSPVAQEYGPRVIAATTYSWAEWARIQNDPTAREAIDEAKEEAYKEITETLKDDHPEVYSFHQGVQDRTGPAIFGLIAAGVMGLFALIAFLTILLARVTMQILVIAAPVAAVLGLLPKGGSALRKMWDLFTAALLAVLKFTLAAGIMAVVIGLLTRLDPVSALIWIAVVTVAALRALQPSKTLKTITPGLDPNRSYLSELISKVAGLAVAGATGGVAGAVVGAATSSGGEKPREEPREKVELTRMPDRPPLPPPTFTQLPGTRTQVAIENPPPGSPVAAIGGPPPASPLPAIGAGPTPPSAGPPRPEFPAPVHSGPVQAGPPEQAAPRQSVTNPPVVITGEVVPDHSLYQRPEPTPATVVIPDLGDVRDKGTDQPAGEIVLYQSKKELASV